ncbi:hypothetical protein D3C75_1238360 [compost metagenome]
MLHHLVADRGCLPLLGQRTGHQQVVAGQIHHFADVGGQGCLQGLLDRVGEFTPAEGVIDGLVIELLDVGADHLRVLG